MNGNKCKFPRKAKSKQAIFIMKNVKQTFDSLKHRGALRTLSNN